MDFNFYYYENYTNAPFDENNTRYVMSKPEVMDILSTVAVMPPFSISGDELGHKDIINMLININVFEEKDGYIRIDVPIFLERDFEELKRLTNQAAKDIYSTMILIKNNISRCISKIDNSFSNEINLYHLLCGQIFDGMMFDFLEEKKLVTTSKIHSSGLDYLLIIYENSEKLNTYSEGLLCSYNRLDTSKGTFSSFGDSNGNRKDFYRYLRRRELGQLTDDEARIYVPSSEILAEKYNDLICGNEISQNYLECFEYFGYVKNKKVSVPVYTKASDLIVQELFALIINDVKDPIIRSIQMICSSELTAVKNGVDVLDIANEIYHLIFGEVNELLVKNGMVATPEHMYGEGRYLKCYERKS